MSSPANLIPTVRLEFNLPPIEDVNCFMWLISLIAETAVKFIKQIFCPIAPTSRPVDDLDSITIDIETTLQTMFPLEAPQELHTCSKIFANVALNSRISQLIISGDLLSRSISLIGLGENHAQFNCHHNLKPGVTHVGPYPRYS